MGPGRKTLESNTPKIAQARRKRRKTEAEKTVGFEAGRSLKRSPWLCPTLIPSLKEDPGAWIYETLPRRSRKSHQKQ
jgi:hypothetical protein